MYAEAPSRFRAFRPDRACPCASVHPECIAPLHGVPLRAHVRSIVLTAFLFATAFGALSCEPVLVTVYVGAGGSLHVSDPGSEVEVPCAAELSDATCDAPGEAATTCDLGNVKEGKVLRAAADPGFRFVHFLSRSEEGREGVVITENPIQVGLNSAFIDVVFERENCGGPGGSSDGGTVDAGSASDGGNPDAGFLFSAPPFGIVTLHTRHYSNGVNFVRGGEANASFRVPYPSATAEVVTQSGPCEITKSPSPSPGAAGKSAGVVGIFGGNVDAQLSPGAFAEYGSQFSPPGTRYFEGGEVLTVRADGGDVSPFIGSVVAPSQTTILAPARPASVDRAVPLTFVFEDGGVGTFRVILRGRTDLASLVSLRCDAPLSDGVLTIPAAALGEIPSGGAGKITTRTLNETVIDGGLMAVRFEATIEVLDGDAGRYDEPSALTFQ